MKSVKKGTSVPFFFPSCAPLQRDNVVLAGALKSFEGGDHADALIGAEYACRRFPDNAVPAILRARVLEACRPELSAKAWYRAWYCDPENPVLQDAMLRAWMRAGALASVRELGPAFLPARCRSGNETALLESLRQAGMTYAGACWREGANIEGIVYRLAPHAAQETAQLKLIIASGQQQFHVNITAGQRFRIACPAAEGVWSVAIDGTGEQPGARLLQGSPIAFTSGADESGNIAAARKQAQRKPVDIIIPVYLGHAAVRACIDSVSASLAHNKTRAEIVVIDDASPEPALSAWLDDLAQQGRITLLRNSYNLGFIETVNRGLRLHADRDVMLLNADTFVHGDWIDRLRTSLYSANDVASVTPWSNNGEITSFPMIAEAARTPRPDQAEEIDRIAAALHREGHLQDHELPACCGFAMMIRRSVLERIGLLDGVALIRGYGEEVDWCLRARAAGYRHLAATGVFIAHTGTVSFRFEKRLRVKQNRAVIARRYPDYHPEYHAFVKQDPLRAARKTLFAALELAQNAWLADALAEQRANTSPAQFLPAAAKSSCARIGIWQHRLDAPHAGKILELARMIASRRLSARLLVIGDMSEALWHTGVVDTIPVAPNNETSLLPDATIMGLAGCSAVLSASTDRLPANVPGQFVDANFRPGIWLANWLKEQHARTSAATPIRQPSSEEACIP